MNYSSENTHGDQEFSLAIVAPDAPSGMIRRVRECTSKGIYTIFDPGQAMGGFKAEELIEMINIADISIMNEAERIQFQEMTGRDFVDVAREAERYAIVTLGAQGAEFYNLI
jgi:sugar/nucleoside kinase (ribokinase family)